MTIRIQTADTCEAQNQMLSCPFYSGSKTYICEYGKMTIGDDGGANFVVTNTLARCKGFSLQRGNLKQTISKNLMPKFLEPLARDEKMEIAVPQQTFAITPKIFQIKPKELKKFFSNASQTFV